MIRIVLFGLMAASMTSLVAAAEVSVAAQAKDVRPLKTGDQAPDVSVTTAAGESEKLGKFYADGPAVLVFYRGSWCPICTQHFQELMKAHPEFAKAGAKIVAISPDSVQNTRSNAEKLKVPFPLVSDSDLTATKAFGLAFQVDRGTIAKYKEYGIDLKKASGRDHQALPVPAVYIVNKAGNIIFAHSDPDYSKRLNVETILAELKKTR